MVSFSFSVAPWRYYLRQEPDAVMPHVRIRAGGRPRGRFLPRQSFQPFKSYKQTLRSGSSEQPVAGVVQQTASSLEPI